MASRGFLKLVSRVFEGRVRVVVSEDSREAVAEVGSVEDLCLVPERSTLEKVFWLVRGLANDCLSPYCDRQIERLLKGISHVILDTALIGRFAPLVRTVRPELPILLLHHNFEPKFYKDTRVGMAVAPFIGRIIDHNQRGGWHAADLNLTFSEEDRNDLESAYGPPRQGRVEVFGYFEDCPPLSPVERAHAGKPVRMIITGNLSVAKGYAGAIWFVNEVLPLLAGRDYELIIAGRSPVQELREACASAKQVRLVADPSDMDELLGEADLFVNPSSIGSGIKVRNFDGLRHGLPVLCHEDNAYGFEAFPAEAFMTFRDGPGFVEVFDRLSEQVSDSSRREAVHAAYRERCGLPAGTARLRELLGIERISSGTDESFPKLKKGCAHG